MQKSFLYSSLVKGFVITLPLFFLGISTPLGVITLDRFFLFSSILTMVLLSINSQVKRKSITVTLIVFIIYLTINKLVFQEELSSKFMMLIFSIFSFYVSFNAIKRGVNLEKSINFSFIIFALISFYAIWHFITLGFVPSSFSFLDSISFLKSVNYEHMEEINKSYSFPRNSLPYPTPPQLSIVMAAYSFYYYSSYVMKKDVKNLIFFILAMLFSFTKISRSGIIPMLFVIFLYYYVSIKNTFLLKYLKIVVFIVFIIMFLKYFNEDLYNILYARFFGGTLADFTEGHLGVREFAINIFLDGSTAEILFGIGIGNYPGLHAHMTILTFLVEIGLIGTLIYISIFYQRFKITIKKVIRSKNRAPHHLNELMMVILVFMGMLFYEFTFVLPLYVFLGIMCGKSFLENKNVKTIIE